MTLKEQIMKLQTYKMYEGEDTVYVERDDVLKALDQEPITWIVGKDNCQVAVRNMPIDKMQKICAIIEDEGQQPCEDCISREAVIEWLKDKDIIKMNYQEENARRELASLPSVTPSYNSIKTELKPCEEENPTWTECRYYDHGSAERIEDTMAEITSEQTRWIPVSERLPEKQGCYLVTTKWKGGYSGDVYIETNMAVYREKPKEWDCVDVIAWMPLPQPYAESEDKE